MSNIFHSDKVVPSVLTQVAATNGALNLTSSQLQFLAGNLANFSQLTIDVGGKAMNVGLNSRLTAAEAVAVEQKLTSGTQGLQIAADGVAKGGTIVLNSALATALDKSVGGSINALTIAHGVKLIDSLSNFTVDGTLTNYGKIVSIGTQADTITANDLSNSGMIKAVGNLFVDSSTLNNSGTISSQNNLSFSASSIVNSGLLSSTRSDVDFLNAGAITVNGTGGIVSALQGAVNFHDSAYSATGAVTANGGNYLSQALNFYAGGGDVNASLGIVSGVVNATSYNAHIGAATQALHLGTLNVANDPTYYNSAGNILIDGSVSATNGNPLAIIASGNVIAAGGVLDTSSTTGAGGNLTVVAGAQFTASPAQGANDTTTTLNITGTSATGGYIDLAGVFKDTGAAPLTAVTTASTTGQAGNVTMVALSGTGANSGSVVMPTPSGASSNVVLNAGGATPAQNGNVTIIGNGTGTNGVILIGDVVAGAASVSGGSAAGFSSQNPVVITNGAVKSGGFAAPTTYSNTFVTVGNVTASGNIAVQTAGQIVAGNLAAPSQTVTLTSTGSEVDAGNITVAGAGGAASATGASGGNGVNGGVIRINASGGIFTGNLDATGGGGAGGSINSSGASQNGGNGGSGGSITLTAGSDNIQVGTVNVSGGGGGGGAGATSLAAAGALGGIGGTGGAGGSITLSTNQGIITEGPLLAYAGGNGGIGGAYTDNTGATSGSAGGGGGGAFGGGGGGGAAVGGGLATTVAGGGGGGAGVYGGGGGGGATVSTLATGGGGGSSYGPGSGGTGDAAGQGGINAPTIQQGGSGGNPDTTGTISTAGGGVFGSAGVAGQSALTTGSVVNATATNGTNATTATLGGIIALQFGTTSYNGLPTSKTPIEADAGQVFVTGGSNASISLNLYGDSNNLAAVNMASNSTLQVNTTSNLNLSNVAAGSLNVTESGNGTVLGKQVSSFNLTLTGTSSGAVFNVEGSIGNLTVADPQGIVQVNVNSQANTPLLVNNISAAELSLSTNNGLVQAAKSTISGSDVSLTVFGNMGTAASPILVNATNSLVLNGTQTSNFFLKDTSASALTLTAGQAYAPLSINLQSASQALAFTTVLASNIVINDTNTAGSISFNPAANSTAYVGNGLGTVSITAFGNISGSSTTAAPGIQGTAINLVSKNGSVGGSNDSLPNYIVIDRNGGSTILTGSAKSGFLISYNGDMNLGKVTGSTISFVSQTGSGSTLNIESPIGTASTTAVLLQADAGIQAASAADVLSAKTVQLSLQTGGNIGSGAQPIQTKAGVLNVFGSNNGIYVAGSGAFVNQTGNVILGTIGAENVTINSTGSITTGSSTIAGSNNVAYAAQTLNLNAATGLTVGLGNVVEANTANLSTASGKITVNGTVYDFISTKLDETKGNLQLFGDGAFTPGTSLTLAASSNVTIVAGDLIDKLNPSSNSMQNFTVQAGGIYTSPYTSYLAVPADGTSAGTGNGGSISITAGSLKFSTPLTSPLSLIASGGSDSTANGGSIILDITGQTSIAVTQTAASVPTGYLQVVATATGNANGGSISIYGGGNVLVDSSGAFNATGMNGNGANLSFGAGKNLSVTADLTTAALASISSGIAGTIALQSSSTTPFTVGGTSGTPVNGTQTGITGGLIIINAPAGIVISQPIISSPGTNYPGGLLLTTSNLQINNAIGLEGKGQLNVSSATGLTLNVGNYGSYSGVSIANLTATKGNITLGNFFNSAGSEPSADFNSVSLQAAAGTVIFPTGQTNLTVGDSGSINVLAKAISFASPNFAFNVTNGGGVGGNVQISTVAPLSIGSGTGQISVNDQGSGGGNVSLTSSGNLNVDFNALTLSSSNVSLALQGTNVLLTNAAPLLTGSSLANLSITSNSSNAFVLGGATKNGIVDSTAGDTIGVGGQLTLVNSGGAINDQANGSVLLSAAALTLNAKGDIGPLNFSSNVLNATSAGNITLIEQPGEPLAVTGLTAGAAKTITFTTAAGSSVAFPADVLAKTFVLTNNGTVVGVLSTNAGVLNVNTSTVLFAQDTLAGGVNLSGLTATNNFALQAAGTITVSGAATSSGQIGLAAGGTAGSIVITGKNAAITSTAPGSSADVELAAAGTGSLKSALATNTVTAATVDLIGGSATSSSLLRTNAQAFDLLGGAINISNAATGAVSISGQNALVSLTYASTAQNAGLLTVNTLATSNGGISIVASTSQLAVSQGSQLLATNGNILLQNNDLNGFVNIGTDVSISAVGSTSTTGKVTLTEGVVPSGLKQFSGTPPSGLIINQVNGGMALLGGKTTGITFTAQGSDNTLTANGANLTIYAGASANGVVLNGNDLIIADPPPLLVPVSAR